jgi:flagellar assembly protein FliH
MTVIKRTQAETHFRSAIVLDLGDLRQQAEAIRAQAKRQAETILTKAADDAKQIIAGATKKGFEEGKRQGMEEGRAAGEQAARDELRAQMQPQFEALAAQWEEVLARFEQQRDDMIQRARQDVVRLALEIAQRIVRNAAYRTDDAVVDQVGKAVEQLIAPTSLTVRINPRDASVLSEAMPALARRFGMSGHAEIIEDEMVDVGGCIVNCGRGAIDATIERQLERIVEALSPAPPEAGHEEETDVS